MGHNRNNLPEHVKAAVEAAERQEAGKAVECRPVAQKPVRRKYGAKPTVYNGVRYASKAEAAYAEQLDTLVEVDAVAWWIGQPKFRLGVPENIYVADFLVVMPTGRVVVVDVKGMETAKFKRDRKLWSRYGPCPLHIIKGGKIAEVIEPENTP